MATSEKTEARPTPEQIRRLVRNAREQGEPDGVAGKRLWPRFSTGMRLQVTTGPQRPSLTIPVVMHNISEGGFAFWSKRDLLDRTRLFVREAKIGEEDEWLPASVCHSTSGILGYLIGAEFDGIPIEVEKPPVEQKLPPQPKTPRHLPPHPTTPRHLQRSLRSRRTSG